VPEVEEWLCDRNLLGGPLGEDHYLDEIYLATQEFMAEEWKLPRKVIGVEEWVRNGRWMEGKSGDGSTTVIDIDGKPVRSRRMKTVEGINSTDTYIANELRTPHRERMQVMQKAESGKIRPVVKTGNKVNRKMNYLSHVMEAGFAGSKASTLFAGTGGNEEIDNDIVASVRDNSTWKVPLDQANFDKRQTRKSVAVVLKAIWDYILPRVTNTPDILTVWSALWDSLFKEGSDVISGEFRSEWDNGLPSGWRWTAVLDTIINAASFKVIKKIVSARLGKDIEVGCLYAQGDDVIMSVRTVSIAAYIMDTYDKLGYEVHPLKTFISKNRAEFLRRSYEPAGVTGYIARSTVGIRFRNPAQEEPTSKAERIYPELCQWNLVSLRGAAPVQAAECFLESMRNQGLDTDTVINYILTPSSVGGGGMDVTSRFGAALFSRLKGRSKWLTLEFLYLPYLRLLQGPTTK